MENEVGTKIHSSGRNQDWTQRHGRTKTWKDTKKVNINNTHIVRRKTRGASWIKTDEKGKQRTRKRKRMLLTRMHRGKNKTEKVGDFFTLFHLTSCFSNISAAKLGDEKRYTKLNSPQSFDTTCE